MPTAPTTVPALPTPATRLDPTNFRARADARNAAEPAYTTALNNLGTNVYNNAVEATTAATDALASRNASASNASAVSSAVSAASGHAAAAAAAAAALQAGLPAQESTDGLILRSDNGVAVWGNALGSTRQVARTDSSQNEIANSGAVNRTGWTATGITLTLGTGGPNGCGYVVVATPAGFSTIAWSYTPQQGVTRTFSCWWRGTSKPAAGSLISVQYRDVSNNIQTVSLDFSNPIIVADNKWRRYSVTATHAGSNVGALTCFFFPNSGAFSSQFADPQINVGATPGAYCHTGPELLMHPRNSYHVNTVNGTVTAYLFDSSCTTDDWVHIKDSGRQANANPIVVSILGTVYIEGLLENLNIDLNGASVALVRRFFAGWVIV